jgi:hypothetical protein
MDPMQSVPHYEYGDYDRHDANVIPLHRQQSSADRQRINDLFAV